MGIALFDEIRIYYGSDRLVLFFRDMLSNNADEALRAINQKNLLFPSLFILHPEIKDNGLEKHLSLRNRHAYNLINQVLSGEGVDSERLVSENTKENFAASKWILESGSSEDGMSDGFDEILDDAAIILCKLYNDRSCLGTIETLIFDRYRKGAYIYDLTWVFFDAMNPQNLSTLANRLRSSNPKDVELARKFLNFIPGINSRENDIRTQYQIALKWINQNQNFLCYTGATNNQTLEPHRFAVSFEAKYLQRPVYSIINEEARVLRKEEAAYLDSFRKLDDDTKLLLSNCSDFLYRSNRYRWGKWLQSPIDRQIEVAERMVGNSK